MRTRVATLAAAAATILTLTATPAHAVNGGVDAGLRCDPAARPAATWMHSYDPPRANVTLIQTSGQTTTVCNKFAGHWVVTYASKTQIKIGIRCHVYYREAMGFGARWTRWERYEEDVCV